MKRKWNGRVGALLVCLAALCALLQASASARGLIDTGETASLTIRYDWEGVSFRLYRVAEVSPYGEYTLTGDFKDYPVSLEQSSQAGWRALAATLEAYAVWDSLTPLDQGTTDSRGRLTFAPLAAGLYLVTGERHSDGSYSYTPEPFLVSLPGLDGEDEWLWNVTASPKYDRDPEPDDGTIRRKVLKVWNDGGDRSERPSEIVVQLLRDGVVWDVVRLSERNNWSCEWRDLAPGHVWLVVELEVPEGYTVTIDREGITFVITNTRTPEVPDTPPPEGPGPDGPDEPTLPDQPGTPVTPGQPSKPILPQTGMLWWPAPLLACAGMGLVLAGWLLRRRGEKDEK